MIFGLFEFLQQFMTDTFFDQINPIEKKTGAIGKIFISQGNLINKFHFRS